MSGTLPSNESAAGDGSTEPDEFAVFFPLRDLLLFSADEQTATVVFGRMYQSIAYCVNFGCKTPSKFSSRVRISAGTNKRAYGFR